MMRRTRHGRAVGRALLLVLPFTVGMAAAQDRVAIEQIQATAQRATGSPGRGIQESDYILGNQSGILLLNPGLPPQPAVANQARAVQIGSGNVSSIDMSGYANTAIQSVIGSRNTVTQQQIGNSNQSTVAVFGNANTVSTSQDGAGAVATITVQGNNNAISAQQQGGTPPAMSGPAAISISQVGNGAKVSVTRN